MSTASHAARRDTARAKLSGVPYATYVQLRDEPANRHLRMTYHDGILEIMSPILFEHGKYSHRLGMLICAVTCELDILCVGTDSVTFRRAGDGPRKGTGKEPDEGFYLAHAPFLTNRSTIDLDAGDPPPDLWIEVDHRASSRGKLPVYAKLGVPEVWRYHTRKKTLDFLHLTAGTYEPIERSLSLPMLTANVVLQMLTMGDGIADSPWDRRLRQWVRETLGNPGNAGE